MPFFYVDSSILHPFHNFFPLLFDVPCQVTSHTRFDFQFLNFVCNFLRSRFYYLDLLRFSLDFFLVMCVVITFDYDFDVVVYEFDVALLWLLIMILMFLFMILMLLFWLSRSGLSACLDKKKIASYNISAYHNKHLCTSLYKLFF